jgi:hypothetical protein
VRRSSLIGIVIAAALLLTGCTYDYLQRTDRVGYSAGDAVRANIARETTNPSRRSSYSTKGLGKDGALVSTTSDGPSDE